VVVVGLALDYRLAAVVKDAILEWPDAGSRLQSKADEDARCLKLEAEAVASALQLVVEACFPQAVPTLASSWHP
jgi:hypothetical protein